MHIHDSGSDIRCIKERRFTDRSAEPGVKQQIRAQFCKDYRSNYEAAKKIAVDFGITPDNPPVIAALKKPEYMETKNRQKELCKCQKMVCEYLHRLEKWKALYAPERPDLPMDERFEEACENLSYIEYLADYLTFADEEEGFEVVKSMKETGYLEDLKYLLGTRDEEDAYAEEAA